MRRIIVPGAMVLLAVILMACAPVPATPAPTSAPVVQTVVVPQTVIVQPTAAATKAPPTNTPAPSPMAQVPKDALTQPGKLTVCTDFPYPPQEFYDEKGNPSGIDIEIGTEIANRLGLQVQFVNSVFDTIIAALTGGKCDLIMSAMTITPDRNKQISFIPYFQAGQSFVAQKGNPQNIKVPTDLCGKSVAAESGTTEAAYINGEGDFKGKGLVDECKKAGKPAPNLVVTQKDTDALQQLQAGKVAVYSADSPVAAYYTVQQPDKFQLVGDVIDASPEGIGIPCGQPDCTKAPLSPLGQAVQTVFKSLQTDGTYTKILTKWNVTSAAIK